MILIGPPLGGKETLVKKGFSKVLRSCIHLPMGQKMREERENEESHIGKVISAYQDRGRLVPDEVTLSFADTLLGKIENGATLLSDGFPRTVGQIERAFEIFQHHEIGKIIVLNIDTSEEECLRRAVNPADRGPRTDGDLDVVRARIDIYKNETIPVLLELAKKSHVLGCDMIKLSGMNMRNDAEKYARGLALIYNLAVK